MPSCSCHLGISLALPIGVVGAARWWDTQQGLALHQKAARLGENRTLGLSNGIMGEEWGFERLQWSAGNTPLLFFSLPAAPFLHPRPTRLTRLPPLSLSPPSHCLSIYGEMHSIHFQSQGFSSGAVLILSEAVSTTSLTPSYCTLPFLPRIPAVLKGSKIMHFINPLETSKRNNKHPEQSSAATRLSFA